MEVSSLSYEILEVPAADGGLRLELVVDGSRIATASVSADVLDDMISVLGLSRESVAADLRAALRDLIKNQLGKVTITDLQEDPDSPLRYRCAFTYRDADTVQRGFAWYDVQTSETGPESVPAIARNQLRYEVHRLLTSEGSRAREIIDLSQ